MIPSHGPNSPQQPILRTRVESTTTMAPKSSSTAPTRASTRTRTSPGAASSSQAENVPTTTRATRSTRAASGSGGPSTAAKGKANGSNGTGGISELITKKLRPLTERSTSSPDLESSGAAMLAATRQALRRVNVPSKPEEREPIRVSFILASIFGQELTNAPTRRHTCE